MTTVAQLRKAALSMPEAEEGTHFEMVAFSVRGKGFASITKDGDVHLQMPDDTAEAALEAHPTGERLVRMGTPIGFSIPIADINGKDLNALVHAAWMSRAPKRLVTMINQPPAQTDLPTSIGRPATAALTQAGVTSLAQVADHSQAELLALHGVGPKAIRILAETLGERGTPWR